ncbi:hypothetical protein [Phormidesmis sp. 146-33]
MLNALNNLDSRGRIGLSAMFGMLVFLALPDEMQLESCILGGWIAGVVCFLGLVLLMMSRWGRRRADLRLFLGLLPRLLTLFVDIFATSINVSSALLQPN